MRPEVEKFLSEQEEKRAKALEEAQKQKEAEEQKKRISEKAKRDQTLIRLGLYEKGRVEVTKDDYYDDVQKIDGVKHYYRLDAKIALDVTDEEYEAILKTLPESETPASSDSSPEEQAPKSGAATFFSAIAYITWIFGFIAAAIAAAAAESFTIFLIDIVVFFFAGAICLCAAEHFKKLALIHQEIKKISEKMNQ